MSVQKLKVIKPIKGVDSYSKNPIIDSLIRQKLRSEMKVVKDSFNQLIRREESKPKDIKNIRAIKKRTFSVQDLAGIDSDRIKQSINYHPAIDKDALAFVTQRQYSSPFHEPSQIQHINQARTDSEDFFVKVKSSDRSILANHQKEPNFYQNLQSNVKQQLPDDLWLPSQAEVQEIIASKLEKIENKHSNNTQSGVFNLQITNRPSSQGFKPLKSNRSIASYTPKSGQNIQITYEPKKYHKSDYQSLEKWLQIAVDFINKQSKAQHTKEKQPRIRQHLNQIYTVYMCAIKEVIRLTYIESAQKGLILEKIWWSMIRLFQELISEQHKLNYQDFKQLSRESKEQRLLYEDRMKKLQSKLSETEEKLEVDIKEKTKIALTGITYKKVNEQMNAEIVALMNSTTELQKQNNFLMSNLLKLIGEFQQRKIICIQKTEHHNLYFYLNSKDQVQVVAKVPKTQQLQKHFHKEMANASAKELEESDKLKRHNVGGLDNQLCSYWQRKKIYLDIDEIVKTHFHCSVQDVAIQADSWGPRGYSDAQVQCPEEGEETFQRFLKKQLESQRQLWSERQREYQSTQITLKDLYDQLKESIDILSNQNLHYKTIIDQKDHEILFQNKKIKQLEEKSQLLTKKIQLYEKEIQGHLEQKKKVRAEIEDISGRLAEEKKKYMFEKENNNLLAANIYQLKEKNEALVIKSQGLEDRIRSVAPCLEEVLALPQATQTRALVALTEAVQKYLGEYVEKDTKLFLTR